MRRDRRDVAFAFLRREVARVAALARIVTHDEPDRRADERRRDGAGHHHRTPAEGVDGDPQRRARERSAERAHE